MKWIQRVALIFAALLVAAPCPEADSKPAGKMAAAQFAELMQKVAMGWNEGNAKEAASCFSEDAIYSSPPSRRIRRGRAALYEYFGGAKGRPAPMHMEWHHLAFDPDSEIGFGEYTFRYRSYQAHGIVVVRTRNGEIRNWREYEIASQFNFERFVGDNFF